MSTYKLRRAVKNNREIWLLQCPVCKKWEGISNDEKKKEVLVMCNCGMFHEVVDFSREGRHGK